MAIGATLTKLNELLNLNDYGKKKRNTSPEKTEFLYGKENAKKPMYQTVFATHNEIVAHCEYCGKGLTRSDVNDYGSLCESCYMKEYYGH